MIVKVQKMVRILHTSKAGMIVVQQRITKRIQLPANLTVDEYRKSPLLKQAAQLLKRGELVAFPTETVYGLGADGTSEEAVTSIFQAKGRPADNPLIIHLADFEQISQWVESVPPLAETLIQSFCPGPLTIVIKHNGKLAPQVTAGLPTVAIRIPAHPIARALIALADRPIAAPSANRSGRPSPTNADHVWEDLQGRIALLIDGGPAEVGVESTVVDVTGDYPVILRPGGLPVEAIEEKVGYVVIDPGLQDLSQKPRSPGMKYRHYAPDHDMWLYQGDPSQMVENIQKRADQLKKQGKRVGILTTEENRKKYSADLVLACGWRKKPETVAKNLFHTFHRFNVAQVDLILAESFPERGIFYSVMNRLKKASSSRF